MTKSTILVLLFCRGMAAHQAALAAPPRTVESQLTERSVELTKEALLVALSHQDLQIRWLAAQKLSQDGVKEAIPALRRALQSEGSWKNKLNIGNSLAHLGDDLGFSTLRETCSAGEPKSLRVSAARHLLNMGDPSCFDALLRILAADGTEAKVDAVMLLPRYKNVDGFQERASKLVLEALADKDFEVRLRAAEVVELLGNEIAIPSLEAAAERETHEWLRSYILREVERLKAQAQTGAPKP